MVVHTCTIHSVCLIIINVLCCLFFCLFVVSLSLLCWLAGLGLPNLACLPCPASQHALPVVSMRLEASDQRTLSNNYFHFSHQYIKLITLYHPTVHTVLLLVVYPIAVHYSTSCSSSLLLSIGCVPSMCLSLCCALSVLPHHCVIVCC